MGGWPNIAELLSADSNAEVALLGAPLAVGSVSPGRCDLAPELLRQTLKRMGRYDVETRRSVQTRIADLGDVDIAGRTIEQATPPLLEAISASVGRHALTLLVGGNNAVTRPAVLGLGANLKRVGLITLDAHFDMRDTNQGLSNGNPVRALIEDGLPGANIAQVGLASFANTEVMHRDALAAGNCVVTLGELRRDGVDAAIARALSHVDHCELLAVDCDIDVVDRSQLPGAPGARPGGLAVADFFAAVRRLAADRRVRIIDLTEWDPSLDPTDLTALTAARWVAECLGGYERR